MRHARVPDMRNTELANTLQGSVREVGKLADTVFLHGAPGLIGRVRIAEKAGEHLVHDGFAVHRHGLRLIDLQRRRCMVPVHFDGERPVFEASLDGVAIECQLGDRRRPVVDDERHVSPVRYAVVGSTFPRQADREHVAGLCRLETQQFVCAVLEARAAVPVVFEHVAGRLGDRLVSVIVQDQVLARVVAGRLDRVDHRHEGAGADEHGNGLERDRDVCDLVAFVDLVSPEIEPRPRRHEHADLVHVRIGDRRDIEGVAPEVAVLDVDEPPHGFFLEEHGTHKRHARSAVLVSQRVVVGQQSIAQLDRVAHDVAGFAIVEHGLGRDVLLGVRPVDGLEDAVLQPADVQLPVELLAAGKAAKVRVHVGETEQAALQRQLDLRFEPAPRAADVAGPRHEAETLRACEAGAHHDERAHIRVGLDLAPVDHARPLVAIGVVYFVAGRLDASLGDEMQGVSRVHLGLAEIAPGRGSALVE